MFRSIVVVCVGNICRSPVGEQLLALRLAERGSDMKVSSAGIGALVGASADETASDVASKHGIRLDTHVARQFSHEIGLENDLILVMEPGHRREIISAAPDLSGRVMLFDHWLGGRGIVDPYRRSRQFHEEVFSLIDKAGTAWAAKLVPSGKG
jgi:protein-tyrosine phosphatase